MINVDVHVFARSAVSGSDTETEGDLTESSRLLAQPDCVVPPLKESSIRHLIYKHLPFLAPPKAGVTPSEATPSPADRTTNASPTPRQGMVSHFKRHRLSAKATIETSTAQTPNNLDFSASDRCGASPKSSGGGEGNPTDNKAAKRYRPYTLCTFYPKPYTPSTLHTSTLILSFACTMYYINSVVLVFLRL